MTRNNKSRFIGLKALLPVCMKYVSQDESRVANIARGKAECYICQDSPRAVQFLKLRIEIPLLRDTAMYTYLHTLKFKCNSTSRLQSFSNKLQYISTKQNSYCAAGTRQPAGGHLTTSILCVSSITPVDLYRTCYRYYGWPWLTKQTINN